MSERVKNTNLKQERTENTIRIWKSHLYIDKAIAEPDNAVDIYLIIRFMGDHDDRLFELLIKLLEELQNGYR